MATSDKKLREINSNPQVFETICKHMDNYPVNEPNIWRTCMGMSIKQLFSFMTEEQMNQEQRQALIDALDAIDA